MNNYAFWIMLSSATMIGVLTYRKSKWEIRQVNAWYEKEMRRAKIDAARRVLSTLPKSDISASPPTLSSDQLRSIGFTDFEIYRYFVQVTEQANIEDSLMSEGCPLTEPVFDAAAAFLIVFWVMFLTAAWT
jgi:hypothetical protein